jgi:cell division septation protein DedD
MQEVFDDEELEPAEHQQDSELTLSPMMVAGLFFGLILLCGLCFGLGYSVGNHGGHQSPATVAQSPLPASASTGKPSASIQTQPAPEPAVDPSGLASETNPATTPQTAIPAPGSSNTPTAQPALVDSSQTPQFMVQIAVLSNSEDASVLTSALHKRGYAVTTSSSPTDNLIHVRVGPFASRSEASQWRLKLLNDGYNAVVQP